MRSNFNLIKTGKTLVVGLILAQSLVLAYLMRPIQDDYFNLFSVQEMGVFGYLKDTWHSPYNPDFFILELVVVFLAYTIDLFLDSSNNYGLVASR